MNNNGRWCVSLEISIDSCVLQYESKLCQRLQTVKDQNGTNISQMIHVSPLFCGICLWLQDDFPFEFKALEHALEFASSSLDSQVCLNSLIGYILKSVPFSLQ